MYEVNKMIKIENKPAAMKGLEIEKALANIFMASKWLSNIEKTKVSNTVIVRLIMAL